MKKLSFKEMNQCLSTVQVKNLHESSFMETYNVIADFVIESENIYATLRDSPNSQFKPLAKVCNSIMGSGKSTALQVVATQVLSHENPLLCVFNNKDNMRTFRECLEKQSKYTEGKLLVIDSDNYSEDTVSNIHRYQIVAITQQRLRDIKLGFGDFSYFKFYAPMNSPDQLQRTIVIDEMPIFVDSETFDIGKENNSLDWFDEMAINSNLPKIDLERARAIIPFLILSEMAETFDIDGQESRSLPTKSLLRHIEQTTEQKENLISVLNSFKNVKADYKYKKRYNWFIKLLTKDFTGVVSREEKKSVLLCGKWLDYREYGNILILDGTANITSSIYRYGGFNLIKVKNYHKYSRRLTLHHQIINTSASSRKKEIIQTTISTNIKEIRAVLFKENRDVLPLPTKNDIEQFYTTGAVSSKQYSQFFKGKTFDNDSMALNLLNTTGKNDLANYSSIALLALPIRHPNYYKLFGIAMFGTKIDVSLSEKKERKNNVKNSNQWFVNEELQNLFTELVLADLSQIIHRTSLRFINIKNMIDVYIYTIRKGWIDQLVSLYGLRESNVRVQYLSKHSKFEEECKKRFAEAIRHMKASGKMDMSAGQISKRFKDWLNRSWKVQEKQDTILKVANGMGLTIDINPTTGFKSLVLY
jgi:hypothetical protein